MAIIYSLEPSTINFIVSKPGKKDPAGTRSLEHPQPQHWQNLA